MGSVKEHNAGNVFVINIISLVIMNVSILLRNINTMNNTKTLGYDAKIGRKVSRIEIRTYMSRASKIWEA